MSMLASGAKEVRDDPTYNVKDGVDGLEPSVSVDIEGQLSARLNTTVAEAITQVLEWEILFVDSKHLPADVELYVWK
jgi:hypothetical protein